MKRKYKRIIIIIGIFTLLIISVINSNYLIYQVLYYTKLFITKLFPAAFFFFVLSSLLIDYGFVSFVSNLLHINGAIFYVVLMSMISGFPSGSKYIKELLDKKIINLNTANYLISFTHFPNPLFVLGTVNLIIKDSKLSLYILISLILSNIIIGIILRPKEKNSISNYDDTIPYTFSYYLTNAVYSSLKTVLLIYGTSIFFFLISAFIIKYFNFTPIGNVLINGFFDLTKGVVSTKIISNNIIRCLFIISFISFGGISIHMQVKSIIGNSNISYRNFLLGRIFQIIIACSLFLLLCNFYW